MQEVPEAGKKKVRPHRGSSHPERPSWGDLEFSRHNIEYPISEQGHLTGWVGRHVRTPKASAV